MKINAKFLWLAALAFASVAFAVVKQVKFSEVNDPNPQVFRAGTYLGSRQQAPESSTTNKQGHHLCTKVDYDFPVLKGGVGGTLNTSCASIPGAFAPSAPGCRFGDRLSYGIRELPPALANFEPYQGGDGGPGSLYIQLCVDGINDGGSIDMIDSGYTICCDGEASLIGADGGVIN